MERKRREREAGKKAAEEAEDPSEKRKREKTDELDSQEKLSKRAKTEEKDEKKDREKSETKERKVSIIVNKIVKNVTFARFEYIIEVENIFKSIFSAIVAKAVTNRNRARGHVTVQNPRPGELLDVSVIFLSLFPRFIYVQLLLSFNNIRRNSTAP